jgi:predicted O-methyltransferase YrrM
MHDESIAAAFEEDNASISAVFEFAEVTEGVNPGDRRAIYHLIANLRPQRVLEIGTHVGASTIYIASAMRRFSGETGSLTTADILDVNAPGGPWSKLGLTESPKSRSDRLGLRNVTFVKAPAAEILRRQAKFDFIFLDGDHSARAVYCEISAALSALSPSGIILLHDFYPSEKWAEYGSDVITGPARAAQRINREAPSIQVLPLGDLPWKTKAGGNWTSLAVVVRRDDLA